MKGQTKDWSDSFSTVGEGDGDVMGKNKLQRD